MVTGWDVVGITLRYINPNYEVGNKATTRVEVRVGNDPSIRTNEHFIGKSFIQKDIIKCY